MWTWNKTQTQLEKILVTQDKILANQAQLLTAYTKLVAHQDQILAHQATLAREIRNRFDQVDDRVNDLLLKSRPGPILIIITGEDTMADLVTFNIILPPVGAPDVVVREITISIENQGNISQNLAADVTCIPDLTGPQNSRVLVTLVDVDDAGNRSEAAQAECFLTDNFAPPSPQQIGFQITNETHVPDPAPVDPVDETALATDPSPEDPEA